MQGVALYDASRRTPYSFRVDDLYMLTMLYDSCCTGHLLANPFACDVQKRILIVLAQVAAGELRGGLSLHQRCRLHARFTLIPTS